jgi:hypothetical protein
MTRRYHANNFSTTLATTITDTSPSIVVTSATGLPTITTNETYRLTITALGVREIVIVTARSGTTLTVTRAAEGTTGRAWQAGATIELRPTADSFDRKQDTIATAGDVINFGDATSFEIPNNATATLSNAGEIALDTSVTDYADGVLCYRAGSTDYGVVAIPKASLASPTNNHVVTYDATTDKFKLATPAGGSGIGDVVGPASAVANTAVLYDGTTGKLIKSMVDPNADRILFWDDSAGTLEYLTLGTNLSITGTTINASGGGGGSGALTFITSVTASASATLDITSIGNYAYVSFVLVDILAGTSTAQLQMLTSTNNGSSYDTGASDYRWSHTGYASSGVSVSGNNATAANITLTGGASANVIAPLCGELKLYDPSNTTAYKRIAGQLTYLDTTPNSQVTLMTHGVRAATTDVDAVRFLFSTGNIASGTIYVYGVSKT